MRRGFTLIELLIVVAIIAILAAIAVPNFLEAQTRAKVSRALADMKSIDTGIYTYLLDHNKLPPSNVGTDPWKFSVDGAGWIISWRQRLVPVTTPVAYLTAVPLDAFGKNNAYRRSGMDKTEFEVAQFCEDYYMDMSIRNYLSPPDMPGAGYVSYDGAKQNVGWRLLSCGPDRWFNFNDDKIVTAEAWQKDGMPYDASNGTVSHGDVIRYGGPDLGNRNRR